MRRWKRVTTPKKPGPAPRAAQNRSLFSFSLANPRDLYQPLRHQPLEGLELLIDQLRLLLIRFKLCLKAADFLRELGGTLLLHVEEAAVRGQEDVGGDRAQRGERALEVGGDAGVARVPRQLHPRQDRQAAEAA